ncbi:hypothetical protein GCM10009557_79850 [Virgisporangium ochraceum]
MSIEVPAACTLPTAERPLRVAEFEDLFATAVREVEPVGAGHVRVRLAGPVGLEERVRDLTARETRCCSFFTFTVSAQPTADGESVTVDVRVPAPYAGVLASLVERARPTSAGGAP